MSNNTMETRQQDATESDELSAADEAESPADGGSLGGLTAVSIRSMQDVFSNWWRRAILYYLQTEDSPARIPAMTDQLVTWFNDRQSRASTQQETICPAKTRGRLRRGHITEMRQFGLLEYDPGSDTVWIADDVTVSVAPPWQ